MTFKINGTELLIQPTSHGWLNRETLGIDGAGHPIYPSVREYELEFQLTSPSGYSQMQDFYDQISVTGSCVVELPRYGFSTYTFFAYSGCNLREPEFRQYFAEHVGEITLLVTNIRT